MGVILVITSHLLFTCSWKCLQTNILFLYKAHIVLFTPEYSGFSSPVVGEVSFLMHLMGIILSIWDIPLFMV